MNTTSVQTANSASTKLMPVAQPDGIIRSSAQSTTARPDFASMFATVPVKAADVTETGGAPQGNQSPQEDTQTAQNADHAPVKELAKDDGIPTDALLSQHVIPPLPGKNADLVKAKDTDIAAFKHGPVASNPTEPPMSKTATEVAESIPAAPTAHVRANAPAQLDKENRSASFGAHVTGAPNTLGTPNRPALELAVTPARQSTSGSGVDVGAQTNHLIGHSRLSMNPLGTQGIKHEDAAVQSTPIPIGNPSDQVSAPDAIGAKVIAQNAGPAPTSAAASPAFPPEKQSPKAVQPITLTRPDAALPDHHLRPSQPVLGQSIAPPQTLQAARGDTVKVSAPDTAKATAIRDNAIAPHPERAPPASAAVHGTPTTATNLPTPPARSGQGSLVIAQTGAAEPSGSLLTPSDMVDTYNWEPPRASTSQQHLTAPARADLAPHLARQLVEVVSQAAHRPVEIALSPAELGRVRMSVAAEDGRITVSILAERPDTLDLMRRHIDQLGQTFRSMGYDQITFSFGQGAEGGDQTGGGPPNDPSGKPAALTSSANDTQAKPEIIQLDRTGTTGVDIRL